MTKLRKLLLLLLLVLTPPVRVVLADTGPKPSMEFTFKQEITGEPLTITSGKMYECRQSECGDAAALQELGPQGFTCDAQSCSALAYGFAPYHKLEIQFSDGRTRQSNIFSTAGFDSKYMVTIRSEDLLVQSQFTPGNMFPRAVTVALLCGCMLLIGVLVIVLIILLVRRRAKS